MVWVWVGLGLLLLLLLLLLLGLVLAAVAVASVEAPPLLVVAVVLVLPLPGPELPLLPLLPLQALSGKYMGRTWSANTSGWRMTKDWPWGSHVMTDLMVGSASILMRRRGKVSRGVDDDDGGRELLPDEAEMEADAEVGAEAEVGEAEADEAFWLLLLFLLLFFVRDDWVGSFGAALPRPPLLPCAAADGVAFFFLLLLPLVLPAALLVLAPPIPAMGPLAAA